MIALTLLTVEPTDRALTGWQPFQHFASDFYSRPDVLLAHFEKNGSL